MLTVLAEIGLPSPFDTEPNHPDRTALRALGRVLGEDPRLPLRLQFDPRGNPELHSVNVLARADLFMPLNEVGTIARVRTVKRKYAIGHLWD
jgi:hypothetical protein